MPARTHVDADLSAKMNAFAGDTERVRVLDSARRFKASWIELGEALTHALREKSFLRWGFGSFEEYCKKELHLRSETALKLTGSYAFLHKRAPEVLQRNGVSEEFPDFRSVDFWQRADAAPDAPKEAVAQIRKAVLDEGASPGQLSRRFKDSIFPEADADRDERQKADIVRTARRLAELLAETSFIPKSLAADVEEQLGLLIEKLDDKPF